MKYIVPLGDCTPALAGRVGGKARGLGFLISQQLPVPDGFAVTVDAYRDGVGAAGLYARIAAKLELAQSPAERQQASDEIRSWFDHEVMTAKVRHEIAAAYAKLGSDVAVAVRSSATAEDAVDASFAGQQDTYLHIRGAESVQRHVLRCWASLFTAQAIGYRERFEIDDEGLAMAVVVQRMVAAETAGVLMTLDPANGDRSRIYVEAALGLGEGVVRGDVGADRYWIDKATLAPLSREINAKEQAHRYDPVHAGVRLVEVPLEQQLLSALRDEELTELAQLARHVETAFGAAIDIEWGVTREHGHSKVLLLQARPETVWSNKAADKDDAITEAAASWDTLHSRSGPGIYWTTTNVGEAIPGVPTPLTWSIWGPVTESALRGGAWSIGALADRERPVPTRVDERFIRIFYGRPAMQANFLAMVGDRMPGTSGPQVVRDIFGRVPDGLSFKPSVHRYPHIAFKLPRNFFTTPREIRRLAAETDVWWNDSVSRVEQLDFDETLTLLHDAARKLDHAVTVQAAVLLGVVTPLYNALGALVAKTGVGDTALLSGTGGAEMEVVTDIWRAARGEITLAEVVRRHGFHGPGEGEMHSRVWREDDSPLRAMLAEYAARDASADPRIQARQRRKDGETMAQDLLAALPVWQRPMVRLLLRLASTRILLRGIAKRSFLQALDVARACSRQLGTLLNQQQRLTQIDDVFYLTVEELSALPSDSQELVRRRRAQRKAYAAMTLPSDWAGMPKPLAPDTANRSSHVSGIGVSPGIVEGHARVLLEPNFEDVQPDEILVAPFTDPSWCSVMFISSALVVDIGGALSHAAIVARELGIPCVVNTRTGSRTLRTGDRLRVDGARGTVEVLESAKAFH